jgi:hypothetical protein
MEGSAGPARIIVAEKGGETNNGVTILMALWMSKMFGLWKEEKPHTKVRIYAGQGSSGSSPDSLGGHSPGVWLYDAWGFEPAKYDKKKHGKMIKEGSYLEYSLEQYGDNNEAPEFIKLIHGKSRQSPSLISK